MSHIIHSKSIINITHAEKSDFDVVEGLQLILVLDGCLRIVLNGKNVNLIKGDLYLFNKGDLLSILSDDSNNVMSINIEAILENGEYPIFHLSHPMSFNYEKEAYRFLVEILAKIYIESVSNETGQKYIIEGQVKYIFGLLMRYLAKESNELGEESTNINKIEEVMNYINHHYQDKITLDQLSEKFFISKYYLSREFKTQLSLTIGNYIKEVRLLHAERELIETKSKLVDIADRIGFPNLKSFNTAFKQKHKLTPSQYRVINRPKELKANIEELNTSGLEFLLQFVNEEDYTSIRQRNRLIHDVKVDVSKEIGELKRRNQYFKMNLNDMTRLNTFRNLLSIELVGVDDFVELISIHNDSGELDFERLNRLLSKIKEQACIPYLQIQTNDVTKWKEQNNGNNRISFENMMKQLKQYLINEYSNIENWYFEFRCFNEGAEGFVSDTLVSSMKHFKDIAKIVVHFPSLPNDTYSIMDKSDDKIICINDYTETKKIDFKYAVEELSNQNQNHINKIIEKQNIEHQKNLYQRILDFEKDDYLSKHLSLIQANVSVWNFLKGKNKSKTFLSPIMMDPIKPFKYFPIELAEKYALYTREGLVTESYYAHVFMKNLFKTIVYRDEHIIVTKYNDNLRILILYPEERVNNYLDKKKNIDSNLLTQIGKKPYLALNMFISGINGTYDYVMEELSPETLDQKTELNAIKLHPNKSKKDIEYYNSSLKPVRKINRKIIEESFELNITVPLIGMTWIELNKVK